jgi:AcrR family transcriptional regulator
MEPPRSIEAAWGLRDRPRKGPKPTLTLSKIADAGIAVAARDGLDAVSMGRVAAELAVAPMSLYRYVDSKDELLQLMADTAWGPPPEPPETGSWRERLAAWAWATRAAMYRHPWALRVPIAGLPAYPNNCAWFEAGLAALAGTSLTETQKASVALLVTGYVRNEATIGADIGAAMQASGDPQRWMTGYRDLLAKLTDPIRFPAITRLLQAGVFDQADGPDDEFVFGLERILDGVARLIEDG